MLKSEDPPSDIAILERSRSFANIAMWTIKLQERRIFSDEPEDVDFPARRVSDYHFLFITLRRLLRAVKISKKVQEVKSEIEDAITIFEDKLDFTRKYRDVQEHIDEYAIDCKRRHHKNVERKALQVYSISHDGNLEWLDERFNPKDASKIAYDLFKTHKEIIKKYFENHK